MLTMEAVVCTITGSSKPVDWQVVRQHISNIKFKETVMQFKTENLPLAVKTFVLKNYIQKPEWDLEKIGYSSKAAGPLALWVQS